MECDARVCGELDERDDSRDELGVPDSDLDDAFSDCVCEEPIRGAGPCQDLRQPAWQPTAGLGLLCRVHEHVVSPTQGSLYRRRAGDEYRGQVLWAWLCAGDLGDGVAGLPETVVDLAEVLKVGRQPIVGGNEFCV